MQIISGIRIDRTWANFKKVIDGTEKLLNVQYENTESGYDVFALSANGVVYVTEIFVSGKEPSGWTADQLVANAVAKAEFDGYYKPSANKQIVQATYSKPAVIGDRGWVFSHDFTDKTSWYGDSLLEPEKSIGTGDGVLTEFDLGRTFVIDVSHGKVTDEAELSPAGGGTYQSKIKVDGVLKVEREFTKNSGGDYTINYATGIVTFFVPPATGKEVRAEFYYATGSTQYIRPPAGKKLTVTQVELGYSHDFVINDEFHVGVFTYNPYLGAPPAKFVYPPSYSVFKTFFDFVSWSRGSFPPIELVGTGPRMHTQKLHQLRIDYLSPVVLDSAIGAELRIWGKDGVPAGGEAAYFTAYGIVEKS